MNKPKVLASLTLLLLFAGSLRAGHIYSWDVDIDKQNIGFASKFNLYFSLESGLSKNGYINVISPINWGTLSNVVGNLYMASSGARVGNFSIAK
jgi:hypothetical protein